MALKARLVATDLDGTLLRDRPPISPRVIEGLRTVQDAGIRVVFVTARNWRSVREIADEAGVRGLAVCSNGAVVYDLDEQAVHSSHVVDAIALRLFISQCRASLEDVCFGWETALGKYRDRSYHAAAPGSVYARDIEICEEIADDHAVTKVLVRHPRFPSDELLRRLAPLAGETLTVTISGGPFVEVTGAGITKAHALALMCDELGVSSREVVAIGDQPNDIPMLTWAGRGVAMGNSHPDVLAAVQEHTAANLEDGAALVLESLLQE